MVTVAPGKYTFTVERGKEYLSESRVVTVGKEAVDLRFKLRRWVDMAALGWYSGETHVHRSAEDLPALVLAEDLNVTFPLSYWVTEAFAAPKTAGKGPLRAVEAKLAERGKTPAASTLDEMDALWDEVKRGESGPGR